MILGKGERYRITDYDLIQRKRGSDPFSDFCIIILGASKKFVYAPYASLYSSDGNTDDKKMRPTTESYVKLSSTKYSLYYFDPSLIEERLEAPEAIATEVPALSVVRTEC